MTVLIVGGGIGGLVLGLSLHAKGIPFHVYEAVEKIAPLGVGINVQPHAIRELTELGLDDQLNKIAIKTKEVSYFSSQGGHIWSEPRGTFAGYKWPQYSIHRGDLQVMLQKALIARAGNDCITYGARATGVTSNGAGVEVSFVSGSTATGDLCIAADGIHSAIRAQHYPQEGVPQWGGTIMWRGTTVSQPFLSGATMAMMGEKKRKFVVYPIADLPDGTQLINWIADLTKPADYMWNREDWNRKGDLDDFRSEFADWDFDWLNVPGLIEKATSVYEYPMVDRNPLEKWSFGRATLLGDAAHAMYPIGSNGASQAILDARYLTQAIVEHGANENALEKYESQRRATVNKIVLANRGDGPDKILDAVAELAPNGFAKISDVMDESQLKNVAAQYKTIAGFDVDGLNSRPSIVT